MKQITIDTTGFAAGREPLTLEDHYGTWTFIIDGSPFSVYGTYAEAAARAKLYVRVHDTASTNITLDGCVPAGKVRTRLN